MQPLRLSTHPGKPVSVVIASEPGLRPEACLRALQALPAREKALIREVLVAYGRNPSAQRNLAVRRAKAPWIWFLDSDSLAQPGALSALLAAAQGLGAVVVGGPNLPVIAEGWPQRAFSAVLGSRFGSGASCARYAALGARRLSSEKELILCDLLVQRKAYLGGGGLREDMYPNEENELLARLQGAGLRLGYEPLGAVRRPRRATLEAFIWQAFRYGRGRARQLRVSGVQRGDLANLAPACLLISVLGWPWLAQHSLLAGLPALFYLALSALAALLLGLQGQGWGGALAALFLYPARHLAYGLGLCLGVFWQAPRPDPQARVEAQAWPRAAR